MSMGLDSALIVCTAIEHCCRRLRKLKLCSHTQLEFVGTQLWGLLNADWFRRQQPVMRIPFDV